MSIKKWAIGALSNEAGMQEMYKVSNGWEYSTANLSTHQINAIDSVKRLSKADDALRKRFLTECFRAAKAKGAKTNDAWPNKEMVMTVTVTETEKYGPFNSKIRTVTKRVPNPNYVKLTELLHGEEYFFLGSERQEEENDVIDEEFDNVILITESGRLINFTQSCTYYMNGARPDVKLDPPSECTYYNYRIVDAAVLYAEKLGKAGLDSIWNKISPQTSAAPAKTTAANNKTAKTQDSSASGTAQTRMDCVFVFRVDSIVFDDFDERYKFSDLSGNVVFGNARDNDYVLIGNRYYRIQSIIKCVESEAFKTNEVRAGEEYVSMEIHNDRIDNAESYEGAMIAGFRYV